MKLQPLNSTNWITISNWCRDYNRHNKYPATTQERFSIALYQIHQGMEWEDLGNKAESYMSAFLHFHMVDCLIRKNGNPLYPVDISLYPTEPMIVVSRYLLYLVSKCQQQIFYYTKMQKILRGKSRFNQKLLEDHLFDLQVKCFSLVPSHLREEGIYNASKIMTGIL